MNCEEYWDCILQATCDQEYTLTSCICRLDFPSLLTGKAPSNKGAAPKPAVVPAAPVVRQAVALVAAPSTNSSDFPSLSATVVSATKITEAKSKKQQNSKGIEPDHIVSFRWCHISQKGEVRHFILLLVGKVVCLISSGVFCT